MNAVNAKVWVQNLHFLSTLNLIILTQFYVKSWNKLIYFLTFSLKSRKWSSLFFGYPWQLPEPQEY